MKKVFFLLLFCICINLYAQDSLLVQYAQTITIEELKDHVRTLASDDFEGRGTGERGQIMASHYIKDAFKSSGLLGPSRSGDPYFQEFSLRKSGSTKIEIINRRDTLKSDTDIAVSGSISLKNGEYPIIFVGYGIDDEKYSDYLEADLTGKIAAFIAGEPQDKNGRYLLTGSFLPKYTDRGLSKAQMAFNKGAVLAIRIDPDKDQVEKLISMSKRFQTGNQLRLVNPNEDAQTGNIGLINMNMDNASRLFGVQSDDISKAIGRLNKGKNQTGVFASYVGLTLDNTSQYVNTENIVAYLEGTDLKNELVVVTAHFDHLGTRNGSIYNGADDNATGTAAVIEIAEAFALMAQNHQKPRRSILFIPVTGEERGLLGSRYYVENPLFPLENTVACVNMDMIGRSDNLHAENPNYVYVYVSGSKDQKLGLLAQEADSFISDSLLIPEFKFRNEIGRGMGGSDHASFEKVDIPVMYFHCGLHPDYHRPTDTWDKIEYAKYTEIARLVFYSTYMLATEDLD